MTGRICGTAPFYAYGVINDGGAPGQRSGDGAYLPAQDRRSAAPQKLEEITLLFPDGQESAPKPERGSFSGGSARKRGLQLHYNATTVRLNNDDVSVTGVMSSGYKWK